MRGTYHRSHVMAPGRKEKSVLQCDGSEYDNPLLSNYPTQCKWFQVNDVLATWYMHPPGEWQHNGVQCKDERSYSPALRVVTEYWAMESVMEEIQWWGVWKGGDGEIWYVIEHVGLHRTHMPIVKFFFSNAMQPPSCILPPPAVRWVGCMVFYYPWCLLSLSKRRSKACRHHRWPIPQFPASDVATQHLAGDRSTTLGAVESTPSSLNNTLAAQMKTFTWVMVMVNRDWRLSWSNR